MSKVKPKLSQKLPPPLLAPQTSKAVLAQAELFFMQTEGAMSMRLAISVYAS